MAKIVRRHPHVFGDVVANSAADVIRNWEQIKAGERAARSNGSGESVPRDASMPAAFAGLSRSLPALAYAQEMQERAASLGYDWPSRRRRARQGHRGVSRSSSRRAMTRERREEFGDLLMVLVNLGRKTRHRLRGGAAPGKCQVRGALCPCRAPRRRADGSTEGSCRSISLMSCGEEAKVAAR